MRKEGNGKVECYNELCKCWIGCSASDGIEEDILALHIRRSRQRHRIDGVEIK